MSSRSSTSGSSQWPTTTFRGRRSRVFTKPNSRPPWADWFRFMKSMSIVDHGISASNCVCRWHSGFCSEARPDSHIFAGEKVCIHATRPTQFSSASASRHSRPMASASVSTGFQTTRVGGLPPPSREAAIFRPLAATCFSVSSP